MVWIRCQRASEASIGIAELCHNDCFQPLTGKLKSTRILPRPFGHDRFTKARQFMKIVFLTAGAAGMYCGSCMHDNALARALRSLGAECLLQPLYTPLRTDETNIASREVFFGGVHIFLLQRFPFLRWIPSSVRRLLDNPRFLAWATRRAASTDAGTLGDLAVSMLRGEHGAQAEEVNRLVHWLHDEMQPDVLIFSNLLIGGCIPTIRREMPNTKVVVILQGDDSFLDHLPESYRNRAIAELCKLGSQCDMIIVNSEFYGEKMGQLLGLSPSRVKVVPLSIDTTPFLVDPAPRQAVQPFTIGYLARIAPEKGLHHLVDAFIELSKRPGCEQVRLSVAGWLGSQNEAYKRSIDDRIEEAGLASRYSYLGSPDLAGKLAMLHQIDALCVPTDHEEPKGLFVLEALAAGVPVVQPARGAFPELIRSTGGGLIVSPDDPTSLADGLEQLIKDPELRNRLGKQGRDAVLANHTTATQAKRLLELFQG
jgi:glycosyltransferase involved in cell wall biosynthesis